MSAIPTNSGAAELHQIYMQHWQLLLDESDKWHKGLSSDQGAEMKSIFRFRDKLRHWLKGQTLALFEVVHRDATMAWRTAHAGEKVVHRGLAQIGSGGPKRSPETLELGVGEVVVPEFPKNREEGGAGNGFMKNIMELLRRADARAEEAAKRSEAATQLLVKANTEWCERLLAEKDKTARARENSLNLRQAYECEIGRLSIRTKLGADPVNLRQTYECETGRLTGSAQSLVRIQSVLSGLCKETMLNAQCRFVERVARRIAHRLKASGWRGSEATSSILRELREESAAVERGRSSALYTEVTAIDDWCQRHGYAHNEIFNVIEHIYGRLSAHAHAIKTDVLNPVAFIDHQEFQVIRLLFKIFCEPFRAVSPEEILEGEGRENGGSEEEEGNSSGMDETAAVRRKRSAEDTSEEPARKLARPESIQFTEERVGCCVGGRKEASR
ncbi:hypothetical protein BDZ88DRAFT_449872 [Geranomyces variabilis]|nr:hypothetical protein BDZ88DRAFT_449872 [Geranomyces variabilis]